MGIKVTKSSRQMPREIPASRRIAGRQAFIGALAKLTDAIRDLRAWRLPPSARDSEREQRLREFVTPGSQLYAFWADSHGVIQERRSTVSSHVKNSRRKAELGKTDELTIEERHFSTSWFGLSQKALFDQAGPERLVGATQWTLQWKLGDVPWLHKWAVFALLWWDLCRCCHEAGCQKKCGAASATDDANALALVLSSDILRDLESQDGTAWSVFAQADHLGASLEQSGTFLIGGVESLPFNLRPVVGPVMGPHPLLETEHEFLQRAQAAWDEAVAEIAQEGLSVSVPRKLELHCEWLVRYHVCGETVAKIVKDLEKDLEKEDIHPTTISKAVGTMADMIDLPLRHSRDTIRRLHPMVRPHPLE